MRVNIAAVHEAVEANVLHTMDGGDRGKVLAMALHGMHATRRDEAQEVQGRTRLGHVVHGLHQRRVLLDGAIEDGVVDTAQLLEHNAAGANVEVAHLGVAHLACGKTHILARCAKRSMRIGLPQLVEIGLLGLVDGVVVAAGARPKPSIITRSAGR